MTHRNIQHFILGYIFLNKLGFILCPLSFQIIPNIVHFTHIGLLRYYFPPKFQVECEKVVNTQQAVLQNPAVSKQIPKLFSITVLSEYLK